MHREEGRKRRKRKRKRKGGRKEGREGEREGKEKEAFLFWEPLTIFKRRKEGLLLSQRV